MKKIILPSLLLLLFLTHLTANAATFMVGEEYTLNKTEHIDGNTYIGGGMVVVSGNINGDLMIGGGNVTVDGSIAKDLTIGGGNIQIMGSVGEDLRIGGGNIVIGKDVGGDMVIGGGALKILSGVKVGGDVLIGGGRLIIDGDINGNLTIGGGEIDINGKVLGNVKIYSADKLKMGELAVISGNLDYKSKEKATLLTSNVKGKVIFEQIAKQKFFERGNAKTMIAGILSGLFVAKLLGILLAGVLLTLIFPARLRKLVQTTYEKFPSGLGYGFAVLVLIPIAVVLALITIIGFQVAVLVGVLYTVFLILAKLSMGIFAGSLIYKLVGWSKTMDVTWHSTVVGIILIHLLYLIPIIGWITILVIFLSVFGNLVRLTHESVLKIR